MASKEEMLQVAQWNNDDVSLQYRHKGLPRGDDSGWNRVQPYQVLDFINFQYRRKPSEPVIMYAPYYESDEQFRSRRPGYIGEGLYASHDNLDSDGYVEIKVFLK